MRKALLACLCVLFLLTLSGTGPAVDYRHLYLLADVAREREIDPALMVAICIVETRCDPLTVRDETEGRVFRFDDYESACHKVNELIEQNHLVAVGMGQIIPQFWRQFVPSGEECRLLIPYYTFRTMSLILDTLRLRYSYDDKFLAAYNGNPFKRRALRYARRVKIVHNTLKEVLR